VWEDAVGRAPTGSSHGPAPPAASAVRRSGRRPRVLLAAHHGVPDTDVVRVLEAERVLGFEWVVAVERR
jgi:hypothetical protein